MGKNFGLIKYVIFAPIARPVNYIKHGGGWAAIFSAIDAAGGSSQPFLEAFITYFISKVLPPLTAGDVVTTYVLGAISAGLAWRMNV